MNEKQLKRALQSVGKRCFVNCYEAARQYGGVLSGRQIIRHDPAVGTNEGGLKIRANHIRRIFASEADCHALRECFSILGNASAEQKARQLYNQHC